MKDIDSYQDLTERTANRANKKLNELLSNWALGLAGEAGEVVDELKKVIHHGHSLDRMKLAKELGDVMWYAARIAAEIEVPLSEVLAMNIDKLNKRYPNGFTTQDSVQRSERSEEGFSTDNSVNRSE